MSHQKSNTTFDLGYQKKKNYKFSKSLNILDSKQILSCVDNEKGQRECPTIPDMVKVQANNIECQSDTFRTICVYASLPKCQLTQKHGTCQSLCLRKKHYLLLHYKNLFMFYTTLTLC